MARIKHYEFVYNTPHICAHTGEYFDIERSYTSASSRAVVNAILGRFTHYKHRFVATYKGYR